MLSAQTRRFIRCYSTRSGNFQLSQVQKQNTDCFPQHLAADWKKIQNLDQLDTFYVANKNQLGIQDTQSLVKDEFNQSMEIVQKARQMSFRVSATQITKASLIQYQILSKVLQRKLQMDMQSVDRLLKVAADSVIDHSIFNAQELMEIERHILNNINNSAVADLPMTIAKILKLGHVPEMLLKQIHEMSDLTDSPMEGAFELLRQMSQSQQPDTNGVYEKLWDRVDLQFDKISSYQCAQVIEVNAQYHESFPSDENVERMKRYLDKYRSIISARGGESKNPNQIVHVLKVAKKFVAGLPEEQQDSFDMDGFQAACSRELMWKLNRMTPQQMTDVVNQFEESPEIQGQMVRAILNQMKKDELDVRNFNFYQIGQFVALVAKCVPRDLHVFKNYLNATISQGFYEQETLQKSFYSYFDILHNLALQGDSLGQGPAYSRFLVILSGKMRAQSSNFIQDKLISLIWTLMHHETLNPSESNISFGSMGSKNKPIIPNLLTRLYNYERKQQPLDDLELLQLYQINLYIKEKVYNEELPQQFLNTIPPQILEKAEAKYADYDKCGYPEIQKEIAEKLLKLRVFFRQNQKVSGRFRLDIGLIENSEQPVVSSMLLTSDKNVKGQMRGLNQLKDMWIDKDLQQSEEQGPKMKINKIDVDEWTKMNEQEKYHFLAQLTAQPQQDRSQKAYN